MPTTLNSTALDKLFTEDIEWLLQQPRTLERDHVEHVLKWCRAYYGITGSQFVIASADEDGYWNNEDGWVGDVESATRFSREERETFSVPAGGTWKAFSPCPPAPVRRMIQAEFVDTVELPWTKPEHHMYGAGSLNVWKNPETGLMVGITNMDLLADRNCIPDPYDDAVMLVFHDTFSGLPK